MRSSPPLAGTTLVLLVVLGGCTIPGADTQRNVAGTPTCEAEHQFVPDLVVENRRPFAVGGTITVVEAREGTNGTVSRQEFAVPATGRETFALDVGSPSRVETGSEFYLVASARGMTNEYEITPVVDLPLRYGATVTVTGKQLYVADQHADAGRDFDSGVCRNETV